MHRVMVLLLMTALVCIGMTSGRSRAYAERPVCLQYDSHGICTVWASGAGSGGGASATGSTDRHSSCMNGQQAVPCQYRTGWWSNWLSCYVSAIKPQPPFSEAAWDGHKTGGVYYCSAYSVGNPIPQTGQGWFWLAAAPDAPDPAVLAQRALKLLTIPSPTIGRYPAGTLNDGRPYTVVHAFTWYWTSRDSFQTRTATASAGGLSSTVTVSPSALTFDPGNGSAAVSCTGPGTAWQQRDGAWAPSPDGCDYQYPYSSIHEPNREVIATYGIDWKITWSSNNGATGTLPDMTTTAKSTFAVAEAESVVTH